MQWLSWWRSMSWIFYREIVKIGRDPKQWQCCMWQKWQAAQAERDGRRIWKLDRGLGQKTRSETALRKRQHEWQIDNTNDKAILNKQIHQSIHCWSADLRFDSLRLHLFNWSPLSLSLICLLVYQDELILDCFPVFHHCCHGPISSVGQLTFLVAPLLKCYSWIGSIRFSQFSLSSYWKFWTGSYHRSPLVYVWRLMMFIANWFEQRNSPQMAEIVAWHTG